MSLSAPISSLASRTSGPRRAQAGAPLSLIARLGEALSARGLPYCQWKGHGRQERWGNGRGDIDLLVDPAAMPEFAIVMCHLGFKLGMAPVSDIAGGQHWFGMDPQTGRLIHVHASSKLVLGPPWSRRYRLPIEPAVLASKVNSTVFYAPAPALELILFVLRQTLRHSWRDFGRRGPRWVQEAREQLDRLVTATSQDDVAEALRRHLPHVSRELFDACRRTLRPAVPVLRRLRVASRLRRRLRGYALPAVPAAVLRATLQRLGASTAGGGGLRLATGGTVVALLGGDGAGKTTCALALTDWLAAELDATRYHLGLPPRSPVSLLVGGLLKVAQWGGRPARLLAGHLELLRSVGTAWDRSRLVRRAWLQAARGGVAICERYPTPENWTHAGPSEVQGRLLWVRSPLATQLRRWESWFYRRMPRPDLTFVLWVSPDEAARRKPEEPAAYVRDRNRMMWQVDWTAVGAQSIDAQRPLPEVFRTLQGALWKAL